MKELQIIDLMLPAAVECLVLVGIHSYLGLHVIRRRVIFVDLALAQIAALGTTIGLLFGMAPDSIAAWIFSMLIATFGAFIFAVTRTRHSRIPHEAFIGVVYAVAAAVIILLVEIAPRQGAESIGKVLTGAILYVRWESIIFAVVVYGLIGILHFLFRHQFLLISTDPEEARKRGMNLYLWDFLFYFTFGVVISISVRTAGVLLVFVFLVAPAIFAVLVSKKLSHQLVIGWTMGAFVTFLGLFASYELDVPSGPAVVSVYGLVLLGCALVLYVVRSAKRVRAMGTIGVGVAITTAVVLAMAGLGELMLGTGLAAGHHQHIDEAHSHEHLEEHQPLLALTPEAVVADLSVASADEQAEMLGSLATEMLVQASAVADDESLQLTIGRAVVTRDSQAGAMVFLDILRQSQLPFVKSEALAEFEKVSGRSFAFDTEGSSESNSAVMEEMAMWLAEGH
ncbi:MAG: metal ABC transporter permease [Proteobacteria bacterium]|nr:metal ABC transporter permease [Pseudomonadota bacterium]